MSIGMIMEGPMTQAQYEQVRDEVAPNNVAPAGLLYHAAGPADNGWFVTEVWESKESLDLFFKDKLGQALEKAHIHIQPKFFQVHNTMKAKTLQPV